MVYGIRHFDQLRKEKSVSLCLMQIICLAETVTSLDCVIPLACWTHNDLRGPSLYKTPYCNPWRIHHPFINSGYHHLYDINLRIES